MALRRSNLSDYLLTGLIRCGRCRRAYVGMSARGNGGTYHYYACTGRQKLGRAGCDGERIPRDRLEQAVLNQLAALYRDGALIRTAVDEAAARDQTERPALEERRRALAEEIRRNERAVDRYYRAFEDGDLDSGRFQTRVSGLETRLDALREQDAELAQHLATEAATAPDSADLEAVADQLQRTIAEADPRQAKALLQLLIKDLRVNGRSEILPTYRIITPEVCELPSSVGGTGLEPVTPSLSIQSRRSRLFAPVRLERMVEPTPATERTVQRTRTNRNPCHPCHAGSCGADLNDATRRLRTLALRSRTREDRRCSRSADARGPSKLRRRLESESTTRNRRVRQLRQTKEHDMKRVAF
jgi:site-specific DNA recombinase